MVKFLTWKSPTRTALGLETST